MLKKSFILLASFLVTTGGVFAFFTAERGKAQSQRTFLLLNVGGFVANLCIKNRSKYDGMEKCTGNIPIGSVREVTIPWEPGDDLDFIANPVGGHAAYYTEIADRDERCWAERGTLNAKAYCRSREETDKDFGDQ